MYILYQSTDIDDDEKHTVIGYSEDEEYIKSIIDNALLSGDDSYGYYEINHLDNDFKLYNRPRYTIFRVYILTNEVRNSYSSLDKLIITSNTADQLDNNNDTLKVTHLDIEPDYYIDEHNTFYKLFFKIKVLVNDNERYMDILNKATVLANTIYKKYSKSHKFSQIYSDIKKLTNTLTIK